MTSLARLTLVASVFAALSSVSCAKSQPRTTLKDFSACFVQANETLSVDPGERPSGGAVQATFLGTSTLLFDDGETQLMVDGFLTRPSRCEVLMDPIQTDQQVVDAVLRRAGVDDNRLRAVFVSHSHYDHALDVADIVCRRPVAKLYGSSSTMMIGQGGGLAKGANDCKVNRLPEKTQLFHAGQVFHIGAFQVTVLASKHSPATIVNNDLGKEITKALEQPAGFREYKEGNSFDFLIEHCENGACKNRILVKPGANFVEQPSPDFHADVLFLGTGRLAKQKFRWRFKEKFYANTVGLAKPQLVIPVHWDNFFAPMGDRLPFPDKFVDDSAEALEFLISTINDSNSKPGNQPKIAFRMLQGFQQVMLFRQSGPGASPGGDPGLNCPSTP